MATRCDECGGTYIRHVGELERPDRCVGPITVQSVEFFKCNRCGDYLFPLETVQRLEEERERLLRGALQAEPFSAFVTAAEAAKILGISRQALHKHRRIRRGFIYQAQFDEKTVYLKKSVLQFIETGDGRFPLWGPQYESETRTENSKMYDPSLWNYA